MVNNSINDVNGSPIVTSNAPSSSTSRSGKLSSGRIKAELVHDLAMGEETKSALAKRYDVSVSAITQFGKRNASLIEKRTNDIMNDYADSLWLARKYDRLSVLQDEVEDLLTLNISPRRAETIARLLRDAAEELGDIPNNSNVSVNANTTYEIIGINTDNLT